MLDEIVEIRIRRIEIRIRRRWRRKKRLESRLGSEVKGLRGL